MQSKQDKREPFCMAVQHSDQMYCAECKQNWDVNDPDPPECKLQLCGRCYDPVRELFPASCAEKPETLVGVPIGQYHCPDCGTMLLAGMPHPNVCALCRDRKHPEFD